jgi:peptidoglycan/xylan/chitin deacetylase (PgdA/CDA1 family)
MKSSFVNNISNHLPYSFAEFLRGFSLMPLPLMYHCIGYPKELPYLKGLYTIFSPKQFEADLDFLLSKYRPIDLEGMVNYVQNKQLPEKHKYFFLSFDDGLRQCSEIIAPILEKKGVPATFFINTGFVGNNDFLHRFKVVLLSDAIKKDKSEGLKNKLEEYLEMQFTCRYKAAKHLMTLRYPQRIIISEIINHLGVDIDNQLKNYHPYMSKVEIQDLISKGFTVGAHSVDHPEYYLLSEEEQLRQTIDSLKKIDEWFKPKYKTFAFPFTDVGVKKSFFKKLEELYPIDITFGCSGLKKDLIDYNIHRIPLDDSDLLANQRIKKEFVYYFLKMPLSKNLFKRN